MLTRIFRIKLQHKIERNEAAFSFHAPGDDVYVVASLLKVRSQSGSSGDFLVTSGFYYSVVSPRVARTCVQVHAAGTCSTYG